MPSKIFTKLPTEADDEEAVREIIGIFEHATLPELQRFCEGQMKVLVAVQDVWRRRFPEEWARWIARALNVLADQKR